MYVYYISLAAAASAAESLKEQLGGTEAELKGLPDCLFQEHVLSNVNSMQVGTHSAWSRFSTPSLASRDTLASKLAMLQVQQFLLF